MNDKANQPRTSRSSKRKLAEWVSLGVSVALIGGIAAMLLYEALRASSPFVPAQAQLRLDQVKPYDDRFILPILVTNEGQHTLRDVRVEIEYEARGERHQQDFTIDYLGEKSRQTIYIYLDDDPRTLRIDAKAVQYRLE